MGKGNRFAQQALSTGLAAVTALTAMATPGFAGNSPAIQSTLDCFKGYGWPVSGRTLQYTFKIFDDSTTQGRNTLTACALRVSRESKENLVAIMPLLKYANSGGESKTQGITPETAKFYSASPSYGSPAPSQGGTCRLRNTGNAEANQRIYNACVRIQVANAERDALAAERGRYAAEGAAGFGSAQLSVLPNVQASLAAIANCPAVIVTAQQNNWLSYMKAYNSYNNLIGFRNSILGNILTGVEVPISLGNGNSARIGLGGPPIRPEPPEQPRVEDVCAFNAWKFFGEQYQQRQP
jgi:hypothetical protein